MKKILKIFNRKILIFVNYKKIVAKKTKRNKFSIIYIFDIKNAKRLFQNFYILKLEFDVENKQINIMIN